MEPTVMTMEGLKNRYFPVLDNGFIALKNYMGDDNAIAEAARCSYGAGTKQTSSSRGLIRRLMRDRHTSPFEMCEIVFHVGLPIFVARQWVRHRTASLNEYSGRYSVMPMIFYTPEQSRCTTQNKTNRQGSSDDSIGEYNYSHLIKRRESVRNGCAQSYHDSLEIDLAREIARIDLPLSTYTYWYWKIDAHNLLHFLKLRLAPDAQWEIRQYANKMAAYLKVWMPDVYHAFMDYIAEGVSFGVQEQAIIWDMLETDAPVREFYALGEYSDYIEVRAEELGMTNKEVEQFRNKLEIMEASNSAVATRVRNTHILDLSEARPAGFYEKLIARHSS